MIQAAYFSPTGTTQKIVSHLAHELQRLINQDVRMTDFTLPQARQSGLDFSAGDLVILGLPVYAGRLPNLLLPYLNSMSAPAALGVAIVLYGNRHYDNGLIELGEMMSRAGMKVIAGGAFVGEHSFSTRLAAGRPDLTDLAVADQLAEAIAQKLAAHQLSAVELPGDKDYASYYQPKHHTGRVIDIRKVKPVTDLTKCIQCRVCYRVCPLGSIDWDDITQTPGICMKCGACIKRCPTGAKSFRDPDYLFHKADLEERYQAPKRSRFWV